VVFAICVQCLKKGYFQVVIGSGGGGDGLKEREKPASLHCFFKVVSPQGERSSWNNDLWKL
jgi:hypothetical protein